MKKILISIIAILLVVVGLLYYTQFSKKYVIVATFNEDTGDIKPYLSKFQLVNAIDYLIELPGIETKHEGRTSGFIFSPNYASYKPKFEFGTFPSIKEAAEISEKLNQYYHAKVEIKEK